jgi:hypothetical protein
MLNVNWGNPYVDREGSWLKGNLHAHTAPASACAVISVASSLSIYVEKGYDFLSLSDHKFVTIEKDTRLVLIPGMEWDTLAGCHTGIYSLDHHTLARLSGIEDHDELLNYLRKKKALTILNHPNWQLIPHYRREQLDAKKHFDGIEIYNAVIERLQGCAAATDKWDYLLSKGVRVLGFASDDSHIEDDIGNGWICVRARKRTGAAIFESILSGNFYCSSGVEIRDIRRDGNHVKIETENAQEIQAITLGGRILRTVKDKTMDLDMAEAKQYVRFAAFGHGSAMAWTQPFFDESEEPRIA